MSKENANLAASQKEFLHLINVLLSEIISQKVRNKLRNKEFQITSQLDWMLFTDNLLLLHLIELWINSYSWQIANSLRCVFQQVYQSIHRFRILRLLPLLKMLRKHMRRHSKHLPLLIAQEAAEQVIKKPPNGPEQTGKQVINIRAAGSLLYRRNLCILVLVVCFETLGRSFWLLVVVRDSLREDIVNIGVGLLPVFRIIEAAA